MKELFSELKNRTLPRPRTRNAQVDDLVVDLASQESYLAGLADSLPRRRILGVQEVRIDSSVVQRIEAVEGVVEPTEFSDLRSYQQLLARLASALADATGVPLHPFSRK